MPLSLDSLAAIATIIGTLTSVVAIVQSRDWLVLTSVPLLCIAVASGWYARRERLALKSAAVTVEGRSIDALAAANLRRRVNRTLFVQEAEHVARIEGEDMAIEWIYSGYCRARSASAMEFSIESEHTVPFDQMHCVAYDLKYDPAKAHPIRPLLVGTEGVSKKIAVPFREPLRANEPFHIALSCTLPNCVRPGFGYYTSTLSFAQDRVRRGTVRIVFVGSAPSWMRVYECLPHRAPLLVKSLTPVRQGQGSCEYLDVTEGAGGQSARVYAFRRDKQQ